MNGFSKIIFKVQPYWLNELCLPGDLNEGVESSLYALFKTIFPVRLLFEPEMYVSQVTWMNVQRLLCTPFTKLSSK